MAYLAAIPVDIVESIVQYAKDTPLHTLLLLLNTAVIGAVAFIYLAVWFLAPIPRVPLPEETTYITTSHGSKTGTPPQPLPSWHSSQTPWAIGPAELQMSVVVPAYNEEERLEIMLDEAVTFLDDEYGRASGKGGYEILLVNDGSRDRTVEVALAFASKRGLHDIFRVCTLRENRGKGGAVTHGLRHVRGKYVVFADADGASKFADLRKLVEGCEEVADGKGRGVAVGSRAHMVGTDAVVKRSWLRNLLMYSFHLLLRLLTPPATSRIGDTQCGFKLFSRGALPYIVPFMHAEGWIFDVEMLMLAESAGIRVAEVAIGWKEIGGSKLNVVWDSLGMAWGLAILRAAWMMGVYRR